MGPSAQNRLLELDPVRAKISADLKLLARNLPRISLGELARRTEQLREQGMRHGLCPFASLAGGLSEALARDGHGAIVPAYLQTMRDSLFCESQDKETGDLFLAAISVRFAC